MAIKVTLNIDPTDKILARRNLTKGGTGQRFFTSEVRRLADPYVPMDTAILKNTAQEQVDKIVYTQPYAKRQYYENKGRGKRGKLWIPRMWADKGDIILKSVAKLCGGRSK